MIDEQKYYTVAQPDYLKNRKFSRPQTAVKRGGDDWISLLSTQSGTRPAPTFSRKNALRSSGIVDTDHSAKKILKFEEGTKFAFPQRNRFNEEVSDEIISQKD